MELRRYFFIVWRWLWLIVLGTVLAGAAAFIVSKSTRPVYSATTTLLINQAPSTMVSADYSSLLTSERLARTYAEMLRTPKILDRVAEELGLSRSPSIQVQVVRDTQLLRVSAEDTDPVRAAAVVNKVAEVFRKTIEEQQRERYASLKDTLESQIKLVGDDIIAVQAELDRLSASASPAEEARRTQLQTTLTQYRSNYASLLNNLAQVRLAEAQALNNIVVTQEAQPPAAPIRPRTLTNTLLAALVGAMIAIGVAFLVEYLDDTVK